MSISRPTATDFRPQGLNPQESYTRPPGGLPPPRTIQDYEEIYPPEEHIFNESEKALFGIRIGIIVLFLAAFLFVIYDIVRENLRVKCWRLYLLVSTVILIWLGLSLYQDHVDEYFVMFFERAPQQRAIYWCVRNLAQGFALYLIVLLLSHLSDFQHRHWWIFIVFGVICVPIAYSVALLVIDLVLNPDTRRSLGWSIGILTFKVFLYNIVTSVVCVVFSKRFCTRRKLGTYSEHRSPTLVLISRWTFAWFILHNLTAIASYGSYIAAKTQQEVDVPIEVHRWLEEALLLMIVLAVPISYVMGCLGRAMCFGDDSDDELEMNKVQASYQQVWSTSTGQPRQTTSTTDGAISTNPNVASGPRNGGASRSELGSSSTLGSIDFSLARPSSSNGSALTHSEASSKKKRHRESYMEAVTSGSVDDLPGQQQQQPRSGRLSTDPIEL